MIERTKIDVINLAPMSKVPDHIKSGTVLIFSENDTPTAIWIDSSLFLEVWLVVKMVAKEFDYNLDDFSFLTPENYNNAVDTALRQAREDILRA